jgi:colicin import membrane protein
LVGGERIGAEVLGSVTAPLASTRKEKEKQKAEPSRPQAVKKEKGRAVESSPQMREKVAVKETKRELQKEPQPEEGVPGEVRDKLIQAALERVRVRAETEGKKKKEGISLGSAEGQGAAALGSGGGGGGLAKGIEFVRYYSGMLQRIRDSWTWVGKRSDLEVTVRFGIQENGEIVGLRIARNSGDASYDDSVFRAVRKASPLPSPPESYRRDFMDVELTFRPKDLGG